MKLVKRILVLFALTMALFVAQSFSGGTMASSASCTTKDCKDCVRACIRDPGSGCNGSSACCIALCR